MILRGPALAVMLAIASLVSSYDLRRRTSDPGRCSLPTPAESIVAVQVNAATARAQLSGVKQADVTSAALRARADTFARYASWRPDTRPDSAALARAYEAQLYLALGLADTALAPARAAVALARSPRGRASEVIARATLGEVQQSRGYADSALVQYDSALAAITSADQVRERGRLCNDIGIAHHDLGALDLARVYLDRTLALREAIADSEGLGVTLNNIGSLLQTVGRPDASLAWFERAIAVRRRMGDSAGVALAFANIGYGYDLMAQPARALEAYRSARRAVALTDHKSYQGMTLSNMARAYLALGQVAVARDDLTVSLSLKRAAGDAAGVSWTQHDQGRVELALGHVDAGLALLDSARLAMRAMGDRSREGAALYYQALAHHHTRDAGHLRQAVAAYADAMAARLTVGRRAGNDADRIMFAEQDVSLTSKWVLAWLALREAVGADSAARASLRAAEQGRARALLDLTQNARVVSAPREVTLRNVAVPTLSYLVTPSAVVTWLSLPDGRVRSACQRFMPGLVDTLVGRMRAHVWALRAEGPQVIEHVSTMLADTTDDAPADCAPAVAADSAARTDSAVMRALTRLLLPRVLVSQLPDSGELVIVPHGQLALVPYAALPLARATDLLGLRYGVRYAPSLAMLDVVSAASPVAVNGASALIVGDPTMPPSPDGGTFDALPGARAMARWLADTMHAPESFTGAAATKELVQARLTTASLVHLGTHGRAYGTEARARDSFIVLAGADSSALLRVRDVLAMPRMRAELVVLMACETGLGDLKESEGTSGLQRAFLARGARSVMVSQWRVNQDASDLLMRAFYRNWLASGKVMSKAEALRRAQNEVRGFRKGTAQPYVQPYYWAGFQLVGAP